MIKELGIEKELKRIEEEWEEYFLTWITDDGGLTMAAVDALNFLHRMVSAPEEALAIKSDREIYWRLEHWLQAIVDEVTDLVHERLEEIKEEVLRG